jgi:hypothetical protein
MMQRRRPETSETHSKARFSPESNKGEHGLKRSAHHINHSELSGVLRVLCSILNIGLLDCSRLKSVMFQNHIMSGFLPDPFVVLVDGISYLATSSFYLFLGTPI